MPNHNKIKLDLKTFMSRIFKSLTYRLGDVTFLGKPNCNISIGEPSYSSPINITANKNQQLSIGKYCSIGNRLNIIMASGHNIKSLSTYPFREINRKNIKMSQELGDIIIGNDVWIGDDVTLLGGCKIEDGVIIGTSAVVTSKQILKAYGVYAGNPAKLLYYRFPKRIRNELLLIKWWNLDSNIINSNKKVLYSDNINLSLKIIKSKIKNIN